jgi:hypothetical protein
MNKNLKVVRERATWLRKNKLTIRAFAEGTGNDPGTAHVWFRTGRTPRRKYLEDILAIHSDWPVANTL